MFKTLRKKLTRPCHSCDCIAAAQHFQRGDLTQAPTIDQTPRMYSAYMVTAATLGLPATSAATESDRACMALRATAQKAHSIPPSPRRQQHPDINAPDTGQIHPVAPDQTPVLRNFILTDINGSCGIWRHPHQKFSSRHFKHAIRGHSQEKKQESEAHAAQEHQDDMQDKESDIGRRKNARGKLVLGQFQRCRDDSWRLATGDWRKINSPTQTTKRDMTESDAQIKKPLRAT